MAKQKHPAPAKNAGAISLVLAFATLLLLIILYYNTYLLGLPLSIVVAFVALICCGLTIRRVNAVPGAAGMYILGGRTGIATIERLAKNHAELWKIISEFGLVMSFGILSWFIFRKQIRRSVFVFSLLLMAVLLFVIYPYTILVLQFIKTPNTAVFASAQPSTFQISPLGYLLYGLTLIGGFGLFMGLLLFIGAGSVLLSVIAAATAPHLGSTTAMQSSTCSAPKFPE